MARGRLSLIFPMICAWLAGSMLAQAAQPTTLLSGFSRATAILETSRSICVLLDIYLADSTTQQRQGLMYVERMDEFEGMLFRYPRAVGISMWMKNTYLPLDMLFIRADGSIAGIARMTTPMSTERIESPEPVSAVLELSGGFSNRWLVQPENKLLLVD